jgi:hypothetical protein
MARWLVVLGLVLAAPAVASAREPVISYVDQNGVFRLYDAERDAEVEPPPPLAANFMGFRYGISQDGRYVVFNDPAKKLHLLDRATNSQPPLPGIDVYANPGGLTVSDTGLIAFDDNGNGPAVAYDSGKGSFVDTGLGANNGHRQPRLSANGRFLATTCVTNCIVDLGSDANPYVQDLATKLDTAFPDDDGADEEHPCIDGDGSVVGFDKRRSAAVMQRDIFLFDRSVSPPQQIDISGANAPAENEVNCVLDAAADYVGFYNNDTNVFRAFGIAAKTFVTLPPDKFDNRSQFSAPYPPPDVTRPVVRRFRLAHGRFRFRLSERANVRITIRRRGGRRVGALVRPHRHAGPGAIAFNGRVRGHMLRPGRYVAAITATDRAGNRSRRRAVRFTVRRAAGDRSR